MSEVLELLSPHLLIASSAISNESMVNLAPLSSCEEVAMGIDRILMFLTMASVLSLSSGVLLVTYVKAKAAKRSLASRAEVRLVQGEKPHQTAHCT